MKIYTRYIYIFFYNIYETFKNKKKKIDLKIKCCIKIYKK